MVGDGSLRLTGLESLDRATAQDLSWIVDSRRARDATQSRAGALLVTRAEDAGDRPCLIVANPTLAMAVWLSSRGAGAPSYPPGVSRRAHVARTARLGARVAVGPGATIEAGARVGARTVIGAGAFIGADAQIGEDCHIHPLAAVLERCRIGSRCILHSGAVVGSDGFGYVWDGAAHRKIPQIGIVRLEDDVEVGANSTIDRATFGETLVGRGTKIDNLVQVGHNVTIGPHSILCGQAGVGGSSRLGERVTLAGQVGIGDHVDLGDRVTATGQAGIFPGNRIAADTVLSGMPAMSHREFLRSAAWVARLPELARRLERLEKKRDGGRD